VLWKKGNLGKNGGIAVQDDPNTEKATTQVTSAELVRSFAKWRDASQTAPVYITTHGRVSHVLAGARLHHQLIRPSIEDGILSPDERLTGLGEWLKESLILCTPDEEILYANARARQYCHLPPLRKGLTLTEAMPDLEGSVVQVQYRRTLATGEALNADIPSMFGEGRWTHLQTIPLGNRLVLLLRDITEEVERYRMADAKEGMLEAISLHPDVSYARITPRGLIEKTDDSFEEWMGLAQDKLHGTRLQDLVMREQRLAFRGVLDKVFEENLPQQTEVQLTPNHSGVLSVKIAIVPLHGAYGMEGASVIMTRAES